MKLGFIGTGALTAAIVTGLKSFANNPAPIVVSPRNEGIAASLASRFADVRVAADNQAVLDACDTVILAVRPQVARDVLSSLRFHPNHHVISLIATVSREDVAALTAPAGHVVKALPMPMIAHGLGATIIYPPDPKAAALFGTVGKAIEVEGAEEFDAMSVTTATFASYFKYLDTIQAWLKHHGVPEARARDYVASLFRALGDAPIKQPDVGFMHMAEEEYATRGGLNEQVLSELTTSGVFETLKRSMDGIHRRIVGS
jgi:pyrroline-5-carboxylate reductase